MPSQDNDGEQISADAELKDGSRLCLPRGLRKSAVVTLLEAGATDAEVAAITGQSREMVALLAASEPAQAGRGCSHQMGGGRRCARSIRVLIVDAKTSALAWQAIKAMRALAARVRWSTPPALPSSTELMHMMDGIIAQEEAAPG